MVSAVKTGRAFWPGPNFIRKARHEARPSTNLSGPGLARPESRGRAGPHFTTRSPSPAQPEWPASTARNAARGPARFEAPFSAQNGLFHPFFILFFNQTSFHLKFSNFTQLNLTFNQPNLIHNFLIKFTTF